MHARGSPVARVSPNEFQWLRHSRLVVTLVGDGVEDVPDLIAAMQAQGVELLAHASGADALIALGQRLPDVIIVRADLHDVDVGVWTRAIRRRSAVPILVGVAAEHADTGGVALVAGATTLVTRPYVPHELIRQIVGLEETIASARDAEGTLRHGEFSVNLASFSARYHDIELELPLKELELLHVLLLHANRVVTTDEITAHLWGPAAPRAAVGAIKTHVRRLRQRIGDDAAIRTVRGRGYTLGHSSTAKI